ncbi:MAG: glutamine--fructose-6-phosphate aminotransferase, partial [Candidatus Pacebacteria bacterium]|nr:glutamine--fructose-6-phosphate aminotransferase [Candidatus Paceibacterota bacterium]
MCGIAGYIGEREASEFLLDALKRLEYRGYDSAGMAVLSRENTLNCVRSTGRINMLEEKLKKARSNGCVGIAHTRWATHGHPSEANAHPHSDCSENIF